MQVLTETSTKQVFNGEPFYLCGNYFQHQGKRLHRTVWAFFHGEIPPGHDVHHINGDRTDNRLENLQLLPEHDHRSHHGKQLTHLDRAIKAAQDAAKAWHGSEAGLAFHRKLGKKIWEGRESELYRCTQCGREFASKHRYAKEGNRFCHNNCKAAFRRTKVRDAACG